METRTLDHPLDTAPKARGSAHRYLQRLLDAADVRLNGQRPWDIRLLQPGVPERVLAQGSLQPSAAEAPPSPCISVCRMDADRQYCVGCLRTLDELRCWGKADATAKRQIWQQIQQRCGPAS